MRIMGSINEIESRIREIESKLEALSPQQNFSELMKSDTEVKTQTSNVSIKKTTKTEIDAIIKRVSEKYGIDEKLVSIVADTESDKNERAVSDKGAMGIMQLMPDTAKWLGVKNPFNPEENIEGGVKFLKALIDKYGGNIEKALAAYNSGEGNVKKYGGIPPFKETQNYVKKIVKEYQQKMEKPIGE